MSIVRPVCLALVAVLVGCGAPEEGQSRFEDHALPVIERTCLAAGCHGVPDGLRDRILGPGPEDGVTLIEWGDVILPTLPADRLDIRITFGDGDDDRCWELAAQGPRWEARMSEVEAAIAVRSGS